MVQIANISGSPVLFRNKATGDEPGEIVEILPGEAASVTLDAEDPRVTAYEAVGLIKVGGTAAQARKAARDGSPEAPSVSE